VTSNREDPIIKERAFSTEVFTQRAEEVILSHPTGAHPLFLLLAYTAPHTPLQERWSYFNRTEYRRAFYESCSWRLPENGKPCRPDERQAYEAMLVGVDDGIGRVIEALKARQMWERTLFVFTSDNGGAPTSMSPNTPLRGGKFGNYEGGIRVVTAMGGGFIPKELRGQVSPAFMHIADWSSTLSFAAGVYQWKSDDSANLFPAWLALLHQKIGTAEPSSLEIHGGERTLVISSDVVIRIFARPTGRVVAYKVSLAELCPGYALLGFTCRPCQDGCLYEVLSDENEDHDLADNPSLSLLLYFMKLYVQLERASRYTFKNDPLNPSEMGCAAELKQYWTDNDNAVQPYS